MNLALPRLFLNEYRKRRKKTALITLALFWGTLSTILLLAFGKGMTTQFQISFRGLGDNLIMVYSGQTSLEYQGLPKGRQVRIYQTDLPYLRERIAEIRFIAQESYNDINISVENREINRSVHGVSAEFGVLRAQIPQPGGRFINGDDNLHGRKVAFIGWKVARDLFPNADPVGRMMIINRIPFLVVGVMQKKLQDSSYNGLDAEQVYIPFSAYSRLDNQPYVDRLHIQPQEVGQSLMVEDRIRTLLGKKYRFASEDRYAIGIWNTIENAREAIAIFNGIEILLGIIGVLSLLIGAVGVTNLMYATVKHRTQEIGVKMALGARKKTIIQQFILETLFIFAKGTFWGCVTAFNLINLVRLAPINYDTFGIEAYLLRPKFSLQVFFIYLSILGTLIFVSGIFPAWRASRLNPIESLRYE